VVYEYVAISVHCILNKNRIENDASNNSSIPADVFVAAVTFYDVEMLGSGATICIPNFMKIFSSILSR
jgi:hypothetical protein